eukprot:422791_1
MAAVGIADSGNLSMTAIYSIIITLFIIVCIYIPLVIFHGYKYYAQSDHIIYVKRYAYIVMYEVYLSIAKCITISIAFIFIFIFEKHIDYITSIWNVINSIMTLCLFYCWVWRFWNLHYFVQWTHNALHNQWKSIINKNHFNYQSPKNKNNKNNKTTSHWCIENK